MKKLIANISLMIFISLYIVLSILVIVGNPSKLAALLPGFIGIGVVGPFIYKYINATFEQRQRPEMKQLTRGLLVGLAISVPLFILFMIGILQDPEGSVFDKNAESCLFNCN